MIPTDCPPSRASPVISSWANRSLYGKNVPSSTMASMSSCMSKGTSSRAGTMSSIGRCARRPASPRSPAAAAPTFGGKYDSHSRTAAIASSSSSTRMSPTPGHATVHLGAAHLLERDLLAGHHLGESRRAEVGGGVPADHDRDVAQRRHVGRSGRRRPEQCAHLRHPPGVGDLVVEDVAPGPATGVAVELLVDAGAGGSRRGRRAAPRSGRRAPACA